VVVFSQTVVKYVYYAHPHRAGYNATMTVVCLSVSCLTRSRERKDIESWKLTERKPVKRVTGDPS